MSSGVLARVRPRCIRRAWLLSIVVALSCAPSRAAAAPGSRAAAEPVPARAGDGGAAGFGVVVFREVGLSRARFVLEHARCRVPPTTSGGRDVLLEADVERCRVRVYKGAVTIEVRDAGGAWREVPLAARADAEGRLELRFADLDRVLRERDHVGLDGFSSLRVGRGGWAGTYDLDRLRRLQADVHATWVVHGRGVPALFAARHPDHPRARAVTELAVEARLNRQEQDFAAVMGGELSPAAFLDRHVWSPLRTRVMAMLEAPR